MWLLPLPRQDAPLLLFGDNGKCYVANEDSDTIVEFDFDNVTGTLTPTLNILHTGSPVCIVFAD